MAALRIGVLGAMNVRIICIPDWCGDVELVTPVWIIDSPRNRTTAESAWERRERKLCTEGVGLFEALDSPESACANVIYDIWLHHGPWSCQPPMDKILAQGVQVTDSIRRALATVDYQVTVITSDGFEASPRSSPYWEPS